MNELTGYFQISKRRGSTRESATVMIDEAKQKFYHTRTKQITIETRKKDCSFA